MTDIKSLYEVNERQTHRYTEMVQSIAHECNILLNTIEGLKESDRAFEIPPASLYISIRLQKLLVELKSFADFYQRQLLPSIPLQELSKNTQQISSIISRLDIIYSLRGNVKSQELTCSRIYREVQRIDFHSVVRELVDLQHKVECQIHALPFFYSNSERSGVFYDSFSLRQKDIHIKNLFYEQLDMYSQSYQITIDKYINDIKYHPNPLRILEKDFAGISIVQQYSQSKDILILIKEWRREGTFVEKDLLKLFDYVCKRDGILNNPQQQIDFSRINQRQDRQEERFPIVKQISPNTVNIYVENGGISNFNYGKTNINGKEND